MLLFRIVPVSEVDGGMHCLGFGALGLSLWRLNALIRAKKAHTTWA